MITTIKCPNCGAEIRMDEAEYNQILSQGQPYHEESI